MFDNLFTSSPAAWTGLIAAMIAIPILIHLINLLRHKTVQWAAMDFLLKSHKKNRNWVWLKQLFLLLSRIAALLLALLMLAQLGCNEDRISTLLGGATTHHYVLLDDSFSMSDRGSAGSAFDRAQSSLSLIAARAKNRQNQLFTLLRFSMARPVKLDVDIAEPGLADLNGELVDILFDQRIEEVKGRLSVSNLATGLLGSLQTVTQLIKQRENENAIVYIVSDFRERDWENVSEVERLLMEVRSGGAAIEMIACAKTQRPNLALTELEPAGNVRVAGTPLMMKLTVKNCSDSIAEKVKIKLGSLAFPEPTTKTEPTEVQPDFSEIPAVYIERIAPGESETRTFPVFFSLTGKHVVYATLPEDAVAADNVRFNTTEFSSTAKVLLIDDPQQLHSSFLSLAISPGGMTGIEPEFRTREFLRDTSLDILRRYDVLFLLDVEALDESAIRNVESFVRAGGGVVFFLGPKSNLSVYNSTLFRNGEGVFPMPLERSVAIPEQLDERVPDIAAHVHPMFVPVQSAKNSLLDLVQVNRVIQPPLEWNQNRPTEVTVAATIRGIEGWPLVVEKAFGRGRSMAFTTTAGPVWNNWSRNATFPPIMLLLQDYLAQGNYLMEHRLVGSTMDIDVPSDTYTPTVTFLAPAGREQSRLVNRTRLSVDSADPDRLTTTIGNWLPSELKRETDMAGVYDVWFRRTDSSQEVERYTLNVDTLESEMALANRQKLLSQLEKSRPTLVDWDQFNPEPKQKPASSLSRLFLVLLVGILIVEQLLAYSTSYHRA